MDDSDPFAVPHLTVGNRRPLLGMTVLVVEDSRYASEALRLMCLRSGARIRRADCLTSARRHLQVYRPSVLIVDIGLPDGSGLNLIEEMAQTTPRVAVILGISGDDFAEGLAIAAGADGFLSKPLTSLAAFQTRILSHLPEDRRPAGPQVIQDEVICPDLMAYRDDMAHIADILADASDTKALDYAAQFVSGVARAADDLPLARAAQDVARARSRGRPYATCAAQLAGMVQTRLERREAI